MLIFLYKNIGLINFPCGIYVPTREYFYIPQGGKYTTRGKIYHKGKNIPQGRFDNLYILIFLYKKYRFDKFIY